jgi:hypothetical protein
MQQDHGDEITLDDGDDAVEERRMVALVALKAPDEVLPYLKLINSKAGGAITFNFEIVGALPRTNRGKCRFIEQRIDITALELRSGVLV